MNMEYIFDNIKDAVSYAEFKHRHFPDDLIHQVAIMSEESGEAVRAALLHVYDDHTLDDVEEELYQTIAVCVRILKGLKDV